MAIYTYKHQRVKLTSPENAVIFMRLYIETLYAGIAMSFVYDCLS